MNEHYTENGGNRNRATQQTLSFAVPERKIRMKDDPFGNLADWGLVVDTLEDLANNGDLSQCQPGLVRILRYKGNWRLREEVLKLLGKIKTPSRELADQLITILDDDNAYYDVRILAGNALIQLLRNTETFVGDNMHCATKKVIEKLRSTPQPPFFHIVIDRLHLELADPGSSQK